MSNLNPTSEVSSCRLNEGIRASTHRSFGGGYGPFRLPGRAELDRLGQPRRLLLVEFVHLQGFLEHLVGLRLNDLFSIRLFQHDAGHSASFLVNLEIEAILVEVSLDFLGSRVSWGTCAQDFGHLADFDSSEQLALGLENEEVGLLLDVKDVVLEQEILAGVCRHFLDLLDGGVQIIVLIDSLQERGVWVTLGRVEVLQGKRKRQFLESVLVDLILFAWLSSGEQEGDDQVSGERFRSHLNEAHEIGAIHAMVSEDRGEETRVGQIFGGEAVDEEPVKHPGDGLHMLLGCKARGIESSEFLHEQLSHLFEGSVFHDVSAFTVENLAREEAPEDLEHELGVLLRLVDEDFLEGEEDLLGVFVFALLVQDLGVVLELVAIRDVDSLLLFETLEGESVLLPQAGEIRPVQHVEEFLRLSLGAVLQLLGLILLGNEELVLDLLLEATGLLLGGSLLQGEHEEMWVQKWSDFF